ncbi:MAG TPA: VOC family protein [Terriglobales bacterium]|nr:VOC family protein [Terriglobales bacterium]
MPKINARLVGVELYFDKLDAARRFYSEQLGLDLADETPGHYAKFQTTSAFVCLERKGAENYPSRDKAVLFLEVADLNGAIEQIGADKFVHIDRAPGQTPGWAVLHDPEGHNVLLLQRREA